MLLLVNGHRHGLQHASLRLEPLMQLLDLQSKTYVASREPWDFPGLVFAIW